MSSKIVELAKRYVGNGISVIPVNNRKMPTIRFWGKYQIEAPTTEECETLFKDVDNIAVLCGGSGRLICFDFDLKYSLNPYMWDEIKKAIPATILNKAYVQSTKNGGYHMVFKCPQSRIKGNQKIASRKATSEEKHVAYMDAYNNPDTRHKALKIAENTSFVLIETRGFGGYYLTAPSEGYTHIFGKFNEIGEDEYDALFEVLTSFNEVRKADTSSKGFSNDDWKVSPMDHYNQEGDIVSLLESHGWEAVRETEQVIDFRRPGSTPTIKSAIYDKTTRVFSCFSTSTIFDTQRSYNHVGVLGVLDFEENYQEVYNYLLANEWGIKV